MNTSVAHDNTADVFMERHKKENLEGGHMVKQEAIDQRDVSLTHL